MTILWDQTSRNKELTLHPSPDSVTWPVIHDTFDLKIQKAIILEVVFNINGVQFRLKSNRVTLCLRTGFDNGGEDYPKKYDLYCLRHNVQLCRNSSKRKVWSRDVCKKCEKINLYCCFYTFLDFPNAKVKQVTSFP